MAVPILRRPKPTTSGTVSQGIADAYMQMQQPTSGAPQMYYPNYTGVSSPTTMDVQVGYPEQNMEPYFTTSQALVQGGIGNALQRPQQPALIPGTGGGADTGRIINGGQTGGTTPVAPPTGGDGRQVGTPEQWMDPYATGPAPGTNLPSRQSDIPAWMRLQIPGLKPPEEGTGTETPAATPGQVDPGFYINGGTTGGATTGGTTTGDGRTPVTYQGMASPQQPAQTVTPTVPTGAPKPIPGESSADALARIRAYNDSQKAQQALTTQQPTPTGSYMTEAQKAAAGLDIYGQPLGTGTQPPVAGYIKPGDTLPGSGGSTAPVPVSQSPGIEWWQSAGYSSDPNKPAVDPKLAAAQQMGLPTPSEAPQPAAQTSNEMGGVYGGLVDPRRENSTIVQATGAQPTATSAGASPQPTATSAGTSPQPTTAAAGGTPGTTAVPPQLGNTPGNSVIDPITGTQITDPNSGLASLYWLTQGGSNWGGTQGNTAQMAMLDNIFRTMQGGGTPDWYRQGLSDVAGGQEPNQSVEGAASTGQSLGSLLQSAYQQAFDANKAREEEIRGIYENQLLQQPDWLAQQMDTLQGKWNERTQEGMNILSGYGDQARKDILDQGKDMVAEANAGATSRGLGNTTIRNSLTAGAQERTGDMLGRLADTLAQTKLSAYGGLTGDALNAAQANLGMLYQAKQQAPQAYADFIERITDMYPDLAKYIALALEAGKGVGENQFPPVAMGGMIPYPVGGGGAGGPGTPGAPGPAGPAGPAGGAGGAGGSSSSTATTPGQQTQTPSGQQTQTPPQGSQDIYNYDYYYNNNQNTENPSQDTQQPPTYIPYPGNPYLPPIFLPGQETQSPGTGTQQPGQGTQLPGQGTQQPGQGTQQPGQGTQPGTRPIDPETGLPYEGPEEWPSWAQKWQDEVLQGYDPKQWLEWANENGDVDKYKPDNVPQEEWDAFVRQFLPGYKQEVEDDPTLTYDENGNVIPEDQAPTMPPPKKPAPGATVIGREPDGTLIWSDYVDSTPTAGPPAAAPKEPFELPENQYRDDKGQLQYKDLNYYDKKYKANPEVIKGTDPYSFWQSVPTDMQTALTQQWQLANENESKPPTEEELLRLGDTLGWFKFDMGKNSNVIGPFGTAQLANEYKQANLGMLQYEVVQNKDGFALVRK